MGQQIHLGGYQSSLALAELAAITPGLRGVDLCCCNGAGMWFLVRFRGVASMPWRRSLRKCSFSANWRTPVKLFRDGWWRKPAEAWRTR